MFSNFFIDRPIFTWVISLFIIGVGIFSLAQLPIEQYPNIAPPKVSISASYPGASATTLENTVTQVIEQNLTGIDNLRFIQSSSSSSGSATITLTFEPGTDPDIAQVQTQNKVSQALPSLPSLVQQLGIPIKKAGSSYALIVAFYSKNGAMSRNDISDFLSSNLEEPLSRVNGVGQIFTFGPEHAMRIWLNPNSLNNYNITTLDVVNAVRAQNVQLATGEIGGAPSVKGQQLNATITAQSLLTSVKDFENIILTVSEEGGLVTLSDVARIELGAENYNIIGRYNRKPASGIAIELSSTANALETIQAVKDRVKDFDNIIPDDLEIVYPVDISPFVKISIQDVIRTLILAIFLVIAVIFIFLQSVRATFIPGIAIPIVIFGTFAFLLALGYSINVLTLFALVLAIGMLVDDAIVVTENVESKLELKPHMKPKEASRIAMREISNALIGTTVVIWAVFLPMTFFEGSVGVIYSQFSVTISAAMGISLFIALTLSPALCGIILKPKKQTQENSFFRFFNSGFEKFRLLHATYLGVALNKKRLLPSLFLILILISIIAFTLIPSSFLPNEDQGRLFTLLSGPTSSTLEQTLEKVKKMEDFYLEDESETVDGLFAAAGFSFAGRGQNVGIGFIKLKEWSERGNGMSVFDVSKRAFDKLKTVSDARFFPIVPPPVSALGNATGFEFQLVDQVGLGSAALTKAKDQFLALTRESPLLTNVRFNGLEDSPQYDLDIDYIKAKALGVEISAINQTLSAALGGTYINDFLDKGRIKRVYAQADAPYRMMPEDIMDLYVRNNNGEMVQLIEITTGKWTHGAPKLTRISGLSSVELKGETAEGVSTQQGMQEVLNIVEKLPKGLEVIWTGISYEEVRAGANTALLYLVSALAIFLILAALYESWAVPIAIMLTVPLGLFGAILTTWLAGQQNNVYFQVGILITIGLAAKNTILVVEFAKSKFEGGQTLYDAAFEATKQRLRPILMTSLTFILGVMPLAFANGPGSGAQNAIGIGILGGITTTTILSLFFAPFFFIAVYRLFGIKNKTDQDPAMLKKDLPHA